MEALIPRRTLPAKHLAGVVGARHVETPVEKRARLAVKDILRLHGAAVIDGASGSGKSYLCIDICERLALDPPVFCEMEPPRGNDMEILILRMALGEGEFDESMPRRGLRNTLMAFCRHPTLIVLDEIHRTGGAGRELVRFLLGQDTNRASFLLVGENVRRFAEDDPAFASRIARWVDISEPSREEMIAFARAFHPLFEHSSESVLDRVYNYAKANKRTWSRVIEACLTASPDATRISRNLLDEALRTHGR